MGQAEISPLPPGVEAVKRAVSPWLWALPIASFTLAWLNRRRILKILDLVEKRVGRKNPGGGIYWD